MEHGIIYVHSKVKLSIKRKFDNGIVKFIRESEDIIAAACTCSAEASVKCLGKCNHVGDISSQWIFVIPGHSVHMFKK